MSEALQFHRQWWVQKAIDDLDSRGFGVSAGLGSGKTFGSVDWHHERVKLNDKCRFSVYAMPIYQKIHDAAIPTFKKYFSMMGIQENYHYKVLKTPFPKIIYQHNGHEIHFISANRPDKIVAVEYGHGTGSEAGSYAKEAIELIETRIRDSSATVNQFMLEGAPQGITHFAKLYDDQGNPGWRELEKREYYNKRLKLRRFRLTSFDNPFLPDNYVDKLLTIYEGNQPYINSYVYGIFCPLVEGSAYNYFNQACVIEDIDPEPYLDIFLTWDFNANPLAWVSVQKQNFDEYGYRVKRYIGIHEGSGESANLRQACVEFARKHPPEKFHVTPIRIFGDRSGHSSTTRGTTDYEEIKDALRELGYRTVTIEALTHNPSETTSVEALNTWFREDSLYLCKRLINTNRSLISTRWKEGIKKLDKPKGEDWTHWSDALKYLAYALQQDGLKITTQMI